MSTVLSIDLETFSSYDLKSSGVYKYVEAPDFQVLMIAFKFDDEEEVRQIDCTVDGFEITDDFTAFSSALFDPSIIKTAFNASFERTALAKMYGRPMPPEQWRCTMIKALTLGLPGSLAGAGMALGLPEDKLKDPIGKSLIRYFSVPCKPTKVNGGRTRNLPAHDPEKWKLYLSYNRQDVVTEQAIMEMLSRYKTTQSEQDLWSLDQQMNDRGILIDVPFVQKIVDYDATHKEDLFNEAKRITGLDNPNSLAQLKPWINSRGVEMDSVTKDAVADTLKSDIPSDVRRVLEIRQATGKTSVKKYTAMLNAVCGDGRLKGILQFYGANRTGRWAGRLVQVHNLAKNSLPDLDLARDLAASGDFDTLECLFGESSFVFSELIRTAFIASPGRRFVVSDFSAIEARVIAWLADEEWVLKAFREGKDIYCETASQMYKVPVVKHGENGHLRQKGKVATLACSYSGGVGAMKRMDRSGSIPDDELQSVVDQWRAANPNIVRFWKDLERAVRVAIETHKGVELNHGMEVRYIKGNLFVKLPSGRKICYWDAKMAYEERMNKDSISYMGVNQETKQWGRTFTYSGKLAENICQSVARDCLAEVMKRVSAAGYEIVMHVHDEMIVDVPIDDVDALTKINKLMADPIEWAPGLPLKGDGYETPFYMKD